MPTTPQLRSEALPLVAAVIGAAVLGSQSAVGGFGLAAVGDLTILFALFAFDVAGVRTGGQSVAFGAAASFCLLTPFQLLANALSPAPPAERPYWMLVGVWAVGTVLLFALDRFRMSSRELVSLTDAGLLTRSAVQPILVTRPEGPSFRPAPIRVEPTPAAVTTVESPAPEVIQTAPQVVPAAAAAVAGDVTAIPPGREATIYLNLTGEGLNVLRTVRAENLGRDYYRIADVMPEGEQWEFTPGQVVRCRKKSLSNGKHMVAYEEAPRAQ